VTRPLLSRAALACLALALAVVVIGHGGSLASPTLHAQTSPTAAPKSDADPFGFAEEDDTPTWTQVLRGGAVEMGLFVAFAAIAVTGFVRKSERLKIATLDASVAYLGIYRSQLISIVNIFGLVRFNLPIFRYNLPWYLFAVFALTSTVMWGRLYCGRVCAFGSMTQLMDHLVPAKWRVTVPTTLESKAIYIKYGILAAAVGYFLATREMAFFKYIEPFWMFTGKATPILWAMLAVLLVATVFVRNLYCRFLCPVGAFLGLVSNLTVFRIKRWSECNTCKICEKTCEWGAIRGPKIIKHECVRCDDCERLYLDQQKCPHWIIIQRKADILARQARART
jgi:polyferredoxin